MWSRYDDWKTTPPEDDRRVGAYCEECDAPILDGDTYYFVFGTKVCKNCMDEFERTMIAD